MESQDSKCAAFFLLDLRICVVECSHDEGFVDSLLAAYGAGSLLSQEPIRERRGPQHGHADETRMCMKTARSLGTDNHDQEVWAREKAYGMFDQRRYPSRAWRGRGSKSKDAKVECKDGLAVVEPGNANQTFRCNNVSL